MNWSVALLRYFNPIGAHKSGRIGEDPMGFQQFASIYYHKWLLESWLN